MDLKECRTEIDAIDDQLLELFARRMGVSAQVAAYKKKQGLPVLDAVREREKLNDVLQKSPEGIGEYAVSLFSLIMDLSRSSQNRLLGTHTELTKQITQAIETTPRLFPANATVACQGVEGAYSQIACEKLFKLPSISYYPSFGSVFTAIESPWKTARPGP